MISLTPDGTVEPVSRDQMNSQARTMVIEGGKNPYSADRGRIGNLTRLLSIILWIFIDIHNITADHETNIFRSIITLSMAWAVQTRR